MTYDKYKQNPLWEKVSKLIDELEENQDIEITTVRDYVIGYLVKNLANQDSGTSA
jgi:hypothetical protein